MLRTLEPQKEAENKNAEADFKNPCSYKMKSVYCADVKELSTGDMHKCNVALNDSIRLIYSYNRWESTRFLRKELKFPNIIEIFHSQKK